jgi:hypothetical protein
MADPGNGRSRASEAASTTRCPGLKDAIETRFGDSASIQNNPADLPALRGGCRRKGLSA